MLEQLNYKDVFMLVQATSPFTQSSHFNEGLELYKNYDSVFLSCCKSKRFYWEENGKTLNYDVFNRPRRRDFLGSLVENGAFYMWFMKILKIQTIDFLVTLDYVKCQRIHFYRN